MSHVIVGTAGHIDHGKSTLVRALTGTDPDRLPEEKRRGITTDLGYAFLEDVAAIIDVPGHERLVHNMVAGATTIDFGLLVVAADDGVMPQTVEHLLILKLLGVRSGAIVVTKCDSSDSSWIDLVEDQIREATKDTFLARSPIWRVDSVTGTGLQEFRSALIGELRSIPQRPASGVFRLPIDRVFAVKGRGTVVTGTILSGEIHENARLVALPGGLDVRVKQLQTHGLNATHLRAGQRAALNLVSDSEKLARGMTLTVEGGLLETRRLLACLELLPQTSPLKNRQRIRLLLGTQEVIGRLLLLSEDDPFHIIAQILLEEPVVARWQDRFVLRRYSPLETLGGGVVIEPAAPRIRSRNAAHEVEFARRVVQQDLRAAIVAYVEHRGEFGVQEHWLASSFGITLPELTEIMTTDPKVGVFKLADYVITQKRLTELERQTETVMLDLHHKTPDSAGFPSGEIKSHLGANLPDAVVTHVMNELENAGKIVRDQALIRLAGRGMSLTEAQLDINARVLAVIAKGRFAPPSAQVVADEIGATKADTEKALVQLEKMGQCRRLSVDLFFAADQFELATSDVVRTLIKGGSLTVSEAAAMLKSSRKYVVPFLEYLDSQGVTMRDGNSRKRGLKFPNK